MWLKLLLLILYATVLFLLARLIETISWYESGYLRSRLLQPVSLGVRKLKLLLDHRGLSHAGVVEKRELIDLIEVSGDATDGELSAASNAELEDAASTNFTCGGHFYEEVEDTKDSVWLVQVVPDGAQPLLTEGAWKELVKKVGRFGIRTGTFDCSMDARLCDRKGWYSSRLILALPQGYRIKDKVQIQNYQGSTRVQAIFDWINYNLASKTSEIRSWEELKKDWLDFKDVNKRYESPVRVIFVSSLKLPPMFLSALSVKFTGRILFGAVNLQYSADANMRKLNSLYRKQAPLYMVITAEGTIRYGKRTGEIFNYQSLEMFLRTMYPEVNDCFLFMLLLVNVFSSFQIATERGNALKKVGALLWDLLKNNCLFLLAWLPVLAVLQVPSLNSFTEFRLMLMRLISSSSLTGYIRNDWTFYKANIALLVCVYLSYVFIATMLVWLRRKDEVLSDRNNNEESWWSASLDTSLFREAAPSNPVDFANIDEMEMELFIERMAVPTLWLNPLVSSNYMNGLPTWSYVTYPESPLSSEGEEEHQSGAGVEDAFQDMICGKCEYNTVISPASELKCAQLMMDGDYKCQCKQVVHQPIVQASKPDSPQPKRIKSKKEPRHYVNTPAGMLECAECVICLESFQQGALLCGLPCGHSFHQPCIMTWLHNDNHNCPVCRWPAYRIKTCKLHQP